MKMVDKMVNVMVGRWEMTGAEVKADKMDEQKVGRLE